MSDLLNQTYRVIRGAIRLPRQSTGTYVAKSSTDFLVQGDLLPKGVFNETDILSWLGGGRIALAEISEVQEKEERAIVSDNPFKADPSTLVGKSVEDLTIMILEIDDEYDIDSLDGEIEMVRLLTSGWDPKYIQTIAPVNDRSRPEALAMHKLEQSENGGSAIKTSDTELSAEAKAGLEAAKAKAQAPSETQE